MRNRCRTIHGVERIDARNSMLLRRTIGAAKNEGAVQFARARCRIVRAMWRYLSITLRGNRRRNARATGRKRLWSGTGDMLRDLCTRSIVDGLFLDGFARGWP